VGLHEALGFLEGLGVVVIAVDLGHKLDVLVRGVGGELLLHVLDPLVLVGGVGGGGQDGDLAAAADLLGNQLGLDQGNVLGDDLADEDVAAVGIGIRVERDDLGAGGTGFAEGRADGVGVIGGNRDDVRAGLSLGVDERNLAGGGGFQRSDDLRGGESCLGGALLAAAQNNVRVRVVQLLGDEGDLLPLLQAVSASAATAVMATMLPSRPVRPLFLRFNIIVLPFSFVRSVQPVPGGRGLLWCADFRWPCG
jgi:hypothetical protein